MCPTLGNSYATKYHSGWDLNDNPTTMPALSLWDLNVAYSGVKNLTLAVGARNLLDKQPAVFVSVSNAFQAGYDISQYDPRGRFVYVTAAYKFF
jgi:iron complex outermembrane recepter protein